MSEPDTISFDVGAPLHDLPAIKTTIDIADDLFERPQRLARRERTTFRALTEAGLRFGAGG